MDAPGKSAAKGEVGMKTYTFEQLVIAAQQDVSHADDAFTSSIMSVIRKDHHMTAQFSKSNKTQKYFSITRLKHLPKFAVIAIAILGALIATGTVYALTLLWQKPIVSVSEPVKNGSGRIQLSASLQNCGSEVSEQTIEVKKTSTINPDEIHNILQARCEMNAIEKSLEPLNAEPNGHKVAQDGDVISHYTLSFNAYQVDALNNDTLKLSGLGGGSYPVNSSTAYFEDNKEVTKDRIKTDDTVLYVMYEKYRMHITPTDNPNRFNTRSEDLEKRITHVIKTSLPAVYYSSEKQNQIAKRIPCYGNEKDSCVNGSMVDIYENYAQAIVPDKAIMREIQIKITSITSSEILGTSSSGRTFTLHIPVNAVDTFNQEKSAAYNNSVIGTGDSLSIRYREANDLQSTSINTNQIAYLGFLIEMTNKNDPIKKY